eukprot:TRINITY_DN7600_c0_g1_i2.p1 TRINITY_DN7600_c0_g1~~TRINITY_DN7600_c0_g1_i2.p1  ORF type:complete len:334 (+),score=70.73 TRINITY_DN7600_c0_g1_i2:62-1003(+)
MSLVTLKTGQQFPLIGLGTWKSQPGEVGEAIKNALEVGYRHFDCAFLYGNENEIGDAFKEVFDSGKIKREEVFVTTKLWNTFHKKELVKQGLLKSLSALKLSYVDLYLIHWPIPFLEGDQLFPQKEDGSYAYSDAHFLETWSAMEELVKEGLVKAIGLSNFNSKQIEEVLKIAKVPVSVLQIECHPYLNQMKLHNYANSKGIVVTAYSPLAAPSRDWAKPGEPNLFEDVTLQEISKKYNKSVPQIILRWLTQRGIAAIPKTVSKERLKSNLDIFSFSLSDEEMNRIFSLEKGFRTATFPFGLGHPNYPFKEEF